MGDRRYVWSSSGLVTFVVMTLLLIFLAYISLFSHFRMTDESVILCLRVLVALIVIYDHINPNGVFDKKSQIDVSFS